MTDLVIILELIRILDLAILKHYYSEVNDLNSYYGDIN